MTMPRLVLASGSPRRRDLLTQIGLTFDVLPANIDETQHADEAPADYVQRLALEKARTVVALHPHATVLAADTTVVLNGAVLNKPRDLHEAESMLLALAAQSHEVHTGLAVVNAAHQLVHLETTRVFFTAIPEPELTHYLATGDSLDKAGAYGIQGYAARWVHRIEGDYFNVMGLPLAATVRLLAQAALRD
jgi:septum formation protein